MNRLFSSLSSNSPALAATLLRIALGVVFLAHAGAKYFIFTLDGTARFFVAHGFPGWMATPVFLAELLGGLALLAGFKVRWVALALFPVMVGALQSHLAMGWMFTNAGGGWEYVAFLLATLLTQALLGSGAYAVDNVLVRAQGPVAQTSAS
ncbi:DoxX family protein [Myxococcus landrumensis]|uniref:DoxX family membrane protein n=1 Tax=Myxococcus landrumensis TaxID=2813577 RepID=A0ABX7N7F3_9BACT|nr:DoxX family membrane protein [Myxococcus landrumus]QSQ12278.1 DoxX family membrane protein [Myxococcus landrumus]